MTQIEIRNHIKEDCITPNDLVAGEDYFFYKKTLPRCIKEQFEAICYTKGGSVNELIFFVGWNNFEMTPCIVNINTGLVVENAEAFEKEIVPIKKISFELE